MRVEMIAEKIKKSNGLVFSDLPATFILTGIVNDISTCTGVSWCLKGQQCNSYMILNILHGSKERGSVAFRRPLKIHSSIFASGKVIC